MAEGEVWHGGDLSVAQALFPDAPAPWIDLSTGINPIAYPLPPLPDELWQRLPGARDETALLEAARKAYRVPDHAGLVAAPGTQILIDLLPRLVPARKVAVLGPTYAEHGRAWQKAGAEVAIVGSFAEIDGGADVVVVVNPNNPDGRILPQSALADMARSLADRGGLLVIDEAFVDMTPGSSIISALPPATLVLRSFGKTYGLAGLRLGFAVGPQDLVAAISEALGPWAVSGPALWIGATALAGEDWLRHAAAARAADAAKLDAILAPLGTIIGGTSLFRLIETPAAPELFRHLGRRGIYVRHFQDDPARLRFGLPGTADDWARLEAALADFTPSSRDPARSLHAPVAGDSAFRSR